VEVRYVPYLAEMRTKAFIEPFSYLAFSTTDLPAIREWLATNRAKADEFLAWSRAFGKRKP
ncbi:MAG TPA: hypothetical protein VKF32_14735, partial [Thermoanaerobaculia bacterium]|nr:hypothetical protein [Thermoanaerobaculia bacterium]